MGRNMLEGREPEKGSSKFYTKTLHTSLAKPWTMRVQGRLQAAQLRLKERKRDFTCHTPWRKQTLEHESRQVNCLIKKKKKKSVLYRGTQQNPESPRYILTMSRIQSQITWSLEKQDNTNHTQDRRKLMGTNFWGDPDVGMSRSRLWSSYYNLFKDVKKKK